MRGCSASRSTTATTPTTARCGCYELARKFDLAVTGSSDYHGEGKPNRLAENTTEPAVLERLLAAGTGSRPFQG